MTVAHAGRGRGGPWRLAPCLIALEAEADRLAPMRLRLSDGSIGDSAHAARRSDHNPDEEGATDWVDALDLTHSPDRGFDVHAHWRQIARNVLAGIEHRVLYLISNDSIFSERGGVWAWRDYDGSNPHRHHGHISVRDEHRQDTGSWLSRPPFPSNLPPHPPEKDDDMGSYLQDSETGQIFHVYGERFRKVSKVQYDRRAFLGAPAPKVMHPWALAGFVIEFALLEDPPAP